MKGTSWPSRIAVKCPETKVGSSIQVNRESQVQRGIPKVKMPEKICPNTMEQETETELRKRWEKTEKYSTDIHKHKHVIKHRLLKEIHNLYLTRTYLFTFGTKIKLKIFRLPYCWTKSPAWTNYLNSTFILPLSLCLLCRLSFLHLFSLLLFLNIYFLFTLYTLYTQPKSYYWISDTFFTHLTSPLECLIDFSNQYI